MISKGFDFVIQLTEARKITQTKLSTDMCYNHEVVSRKIRVYNKIQHMTNNLVQFE